MIYIVIGILVVVLVYVLIVYNKLVALNNIVKEAFSTMDVYLKKRFDLIPNLVETVKGYSEHEKSTLEEVVKLRNVSYDSLDQDSKIDNSEKLNKNIGKLMLLAESYPELKANKNFINLNDNLIIIENDIANARKYYNGAVRAFNNKIQVFPNNIFAGIFNFKERKSFEIGMEERKNQKIDL